MKERVIRVFISSTFQDMKDERDVLVRHVFPVLKKLCYDRQVEFSEVDLRWGITDEQKSEGKVLPICLEEIKRCRPYFIGILGERYGWVPSEIESSVLENEPWIREQLSSSVTELEILQGVLNNPAMGEHAFFYFRSKDYIDGIPPGERVLFEEQSSREEIAAFGAGEAAAIVERRKAKLGRLKDLIRKSNFPLRENYPDPITFGELVLRDFTELINRLFPEGEFPDKLEQEASFHESFAMMRNRCYIGGDEYFTALNKHFDAISPPLIISGESGSGKSSLLSNWAVKFRKSHPEILIFMHFIGSSNISADLTEMLKRLLGELNKYYKLERNIPEKKEEILSTFAGVLKEISGRKKCVIILDAINKLESGERKQDFSWLPDNIPGNIRIMISTLQGWSMDVLISRGWPVLAIKSFSTENKKEFITKYLAQYSKNLAGDIAETIINRQQTSNPLFLQTLLEELRIYGDHTSLKERCEFYLQAKDPIELFRKLFDRYEADYEAERPGLIEDTLSYIWASRYGLTEDELIEFARQADSRTFRIQWSRFYIPAEHLFTISSGLINFSYDYLSAAVEQHYLASEFKKTKIRTRMAAFFGNVFEIRIDDNSTVDKDALTELEELAHNWIWMGVKPRIIREIEWQYYKAGKWHDLYSYLSKPAFLERSMAISRSETKIYWTAIQENTELTFAEAYKKYISDPEVYKDNEYILQAVASAASLLGFNDVSYRLQQPLMEKYRENPKKDDYLDAKISQAWNLSRMERFEDSLALLAEVEKESEQDGALEKLRRVYNEQASILQRIGKHEESISVAKKAETICRQTGNKKSLAVSLYTQGMNLNFLKKLDEALKLLNEALRLEQEVDDIDGKGYTYGELAHNYLKRKEYPTALEYIKKKEEVCKKTGYVKGLAIAYNLHASILTEMNNFPEALKYLKLADEKEVEAGSPSGIALAKMNIGSFLLKMKSYKEALPYLEDAVERYDKIPDITSKANACMRYSELLNEMGNYCKAFDLSRIAIDLFITNESKIGLYKCARLQLTILGNQKRYNELSAVVKTIFCRIREINPHWKNQKFSKLNALGKAVDELCKQQKEELAARKKGDKAAVQFAIGMQFNILIPLEIYWRNEFSKLLDEREMLCTEEGLLAGLAEVYYYRGKLANNDGLFPESLKHLDVSMNYAEKSGYADMYYLAGYEKGLVFINIRDTKAAFKWLKFAQSNLENRVPEYILDEIKNHLKEIGPVEQETSTEDGVKPTAGQDSGSTQTVELSFEEINKRYEEFLNAAVMSNVDKIRDLDFVGKQMLMNSVGTIIQEGFSQSARESLQALNIHFAKLQRFPDFSQVLSICGNILVELKNYQNAFDLFKEQESICTMACDLEGKTESLHSQAQIFKILRKHLESLVFFQKEENLLIELQKPERLAKNYNSQFEVCQAQGMVSDAILICKKREDLCKKHNLLEDLTDAYIDHALILADAGKRREAWEINNRAIEISRKTKNLQSLQIALGNCALDLLTFGDFPPALELCREKESICSQIGNQRELAVANGIQGLIYTQLGQMEKAFQYLVIEEEICRKIGARDRLQVSITNKAGILVQWGRVEEALALLKEKEEICRELSISYGLANAMMNQAKLLFYLSRFREALLCADEANEMILRCGYEGYKHEIAELIDQIKKIDITKSAATAPLYNQIAANKNKVFKLDDQKENKVISTEEHLKAKQDTKMQDLDETYKLNYRDAENAFAINNWETAYNLYLKLVQQGKYNANDLRYKMALCKINSLGLSNQEIINNIQVLIKLLQEKGATDKAEMISQKLSERLEEIKKEELVQKNAQKPWWKKMF